MIVVSNTSPLNYLVLIGAVDILPQLFKQISIPKAVKEELLHKESPEIVQTWIDDSPDWLNIHDVNFVADHALKRLHPGEYEAILLAEQLRANLLILDDKEARDTAIVRGLKVIGLVGLLDYTGSIGLIDIEDAIIRLQKTTFRVSPKLLRTVLQKHAHSKH